MGLLQYEEGLWAEELLDDACDALRPDVVALTDAFDFPDRLLNSTIGRQDGKVYESLFDEARRSALNQPPDLEEKGGVPVYLKVLEHRLDKESPGSLGGEPGYPLAAARRAG